MPDPASGPPPAISGRAQRPRRIARIQVDGLDAAEAQSILSDAQAFASELEAGLDRSASLGVRGVPAFFVDGQPLGSGAPSVEALRQYLEQSCAAG